MKAATRSRSPGGASPLCRGVAPGDSELPLARRGFGMPVAALAGGEWQHPAGAGMAAWGWGWVGDGESCRFMVSASDY